MRTRPDVTGAARKLRDEVRRLIRLHLTAVWLVALFVGVAAAALVHAMLFASGTGGITGPMFVWSTLILLLLAAYAGWRRAFGRQRVDRLVRENLLLNYPRHRQELEAWLSVELVGSSAELVRRLLEVRLDRGLARRPWVPLRRSHFAGMALVLLGCLALGLLYPLLGQHAGKSLRGYLKALGGGGPGEPPVITGLSLGSRWVRACDLANLEIEFDRDVSGAPKLLAHSGGKSGSHDF